MSTRIPANRAVFRLSEVADLTGGTLLGPDRDCVGVVTDSRGVADGQLFVALVGERFDAHQFLHDLGSVAGAVVCRGAEVPEGLSVVAVDDTLDALGCLAQAHRIRWGGTVVALTGSAGKTTTKELITAALVGAGADVSATRGNLNNRIGVPMTLLALDLDGPEEIAVVEMGTSAPGEIEALAGVALPDVALVTLVGAAHTEGLGSVDDVFAEKVSLFEVLDHEDVAIVNSDDPRLRAVSVGARRLEYGSSPDADVRLLSYRVGPEGTTATYRVGERDFEAHLQLLGRGAALAGAGALAVALALALDVDRAAKGLRSVAPVNGRLSLTRRADGVWIIDDSYNANPASMRLALETARALAQSRQSGRVIAVLGDMRELGAQEARAHEQVLRSALKNGAQAHASAQSDSKVQLTLVGKAMRAAAEALPADLGAAELTTVEDASEVSLDLRSGDVVLVKGSRSLGMERVVARLLTQGGGEP